MSCIDIASETEILKKWEQILPLIEVKDRYYHLRKYKNCCVGKEIVDIIVRQYPEMKRVDAVIFGQRLANLGIISHVARMQSFRDGWYFYHLDTLDEEEDSMSSSSHSFFHSFFSQ